MRPAPWLVSTSCARLSTTCRSSTTGSRPFWKQLLKKMSPKLEPIDAAYAHLLQRPHRPLARGAAAEVDAGEQDLRAAVGLAVEDELGVLRAVRLVAQGREAPFPERAAHRVADQAVDRDDHVGVDVLAHDGRGDRIERRKLVHGSLSHPAYVGDGPGDRGGGGHRGAGEVGARARPLPPDEIAVGGGDRALAAAARSPRWRRGTWSSRARATRSRPP